MKSTREDRIFDLINYTLLGLLLIVFIYPLYFILIASVSDPNAVWGGKVWLVPIDAGFDGYRRILQENNIWLGYRNTIFYTVFGTLINLFMTVTAAYPLSRKDFYPGKLLMRLYTFTMFFGGGLIPTYLLVKNLGMRDTVWAMLIPGAVSVWNIIITRSFFQSNIPDELLEAAKIDGCTNVVFLMKMVIPLSAPILAVMALYYGIGHWNAFFNAMIYLSNKELYPLQVFLREILLVNQMSSDLIGVDASQALEAAKLAESIKYGIIVVASVPVLCVYPFVQKHFVKGVMVGSLKG